LPHFSDFRLENGLRVLAANHDDMPEISARLLLPFGSVEDERARVGTALLVARALTEGTETRSAREVAQWLDHLGARFGVEVTHDNASLSVRFLSRVLDGALEFLAEVTAQPAFDEDEVSRLRDERLDEIAAGMDEPRVVASLRMGEAMFGGHPYGMRAGGTEETVKEIDAATLRSYHRRYYRPGAATLILVGDLPAEEELRQGLETAFGGWQGDGVERGALADAEPPASRRIWAVNWPGPQSEIRIGDVGIARLDPDYPAALLMNAILGGLFSSRINMNLREDKGWTYGASSRLDARRRRGSLFVATAVDAKASVGAVSEILGEMERMKSDPPSPEEMELAVNSLTLSLPRMFETVGQVSGRRAQQVMHGLPDDYWETYADSVRAVGEEDVRLIAERLLDTARTSIVVVGPVGDFRAELEALGRLEIRDIHGRPSNL
jgi:predicted Zn-dependent peptidase